MPRIFVNRNDLFVLREIEQLRGDATARHPIRGILVQFFDFLEDPGVGEAMPVRHLNRSSNPVRYGHLNIGELRYRQ